MTSGLTSIGSKKKPEEQAGPNIVVPKDQIALTEKAAQKIGQIAEREGKPGQMLRVGIQGGGCLDLRHASRSDAADGTSREIHSSRLR